MEFNKVLLSLVLVNGVLVNSLQAASIDLSNPTQLNELVAKYGPVNSSEPITKQVVIDLVNASADATDSVQSNAFSAMVRAQVSDDTTLSGIGKKRTRDVALSTDDVTLIKDALTPTKSQAERQNAAKRLKNDSKSSSSGSGSGSSVDTDILNWYTAEQAKNPAWFDSGLDLSRIALSKRKVDGLPILSYAVYSKPEVDFIKRLIVLGAPVDRQSYLDNLGYAVSEGRVSGNDVTDLKQLINS